MTAYFGFSVVWYLSTKNGFTILFLGTGDLNENRWDVLNMENEVKTF